MASSTTLTKDMKHRDRELVPAFLVYAMFGLMLATLALVGYASVTGRAVTSVVPHSDIVVEKTITLDGSRSAGVKVLDTNGVILARSNDNMNGFIDVIWVSVTRERVVQGAPVNGPLRVVRRANGHVAIIDDSTSWKIELIGYGKDNVAAFARLLD